MSPWHAGLKRSSTLRAYFAGTADPVPQNTAGNFSISLEAARIDPELVLRGRWKGIGGARGPAAAAHHAGGKRRAASSARRRQGLRAGGGCWTAGATKEGGLLKRSPLWGTHFRFIRSEV